MCDPCDFGGETFDVCFFNFELLLCGEHWEVAVVDTHFLDALVKPCLNNLPYCVGRRLDIS